MTAKQLNEALLDQLGAATQVTEQGRSLAITLPFSVASLGAGITVFATKRAGKWYVSDGGWLGMQLYGNPAEEDHAMYLRLLQELLTRYEVQQTLDQRRLLVYFTHSAEEKHLAALVLHFGQFVVEVAGLQQIHFTDRKEVQERESYRQLVDQFLVQRVSGAKLNASLDDLQEVKFSAIYQRDQRLKLVQYITGATQNAFLNAITKAIVNFELAEKSRLFPMVAGRFCIVNDQAEGYHLNRLQIYLNYLNERSSTSYLCWSEPEKVEAHLKKT
jgi:hypothetical protein